MSGAVTASLPWLVARSAGLVAFGLLTLSTWLGLAMSNRLLPPRLMSRLLGWHRTLAWSAISMVGLHVGALMLDPFAHMTPLRALVPFAATWRPAAVAAGIVAGWLMLALASSFRMRRWIGQRNWRRLHFASFAAFLLALGHALTAGTDLAGIGGPILALVAGAPVLWLTLLRVLTPRARPGAAARPRTAT
jgi:predicted ferric reductase